MFRTWFKRATSEENVFLLLLGYRWLSLLLPILALLLRPTPNAIPWLVLGAAVLDNLLLSVFYPRLNRLVLEQPLWFGVDLAFVAVLIALTGGALSPYYLFALSPIFAAAFFFQLRGGLITAGIFTCLYLLALGESQSLGSTASNPLTALTAIISFFLTAMVFGYASILLKRIREASAELSKTHAELVRKNQSLERSNRELESIHALALAMQSSSIDVFDVQEKILTTITGELEFERVMLALVEPESDVLMGWLTHRRRNWNQAPDGLFHTSEIALRAESGLLAQVVLEGKPRYVADATPPTNEPALNARLNLAPYAVLPLVMRDHPVGVLVVDNPDTRTPISPESLRSLTSVANQAALTLGSTKLCIERAQRLAIEEERNRIAMEIHDTASQSLFGIVYALDACIKLLPEQPQEVKARLVDTRATAQRTMNDLRRSVYDIWAGELDAQQFVAELRQHLLKLEAPKSLQVDIQVRGDLDTLSTETRKNLLRIAEEGLSNVVKHSGAKQAQVVLEADLNGACLNISDDGRGFDPGNGHGVGFGLKSIRERARAIGGEMRLDSRPGAGTRLEVELAACAPIVVQKGM
jgi:signal transduction histidine kinase